MPARVPLPPAAVALPEHGPALRGFERASRTFDAACAAHDHARDVLLNRLAWFDLQPRLIVDAGCGTGRGLTALRRRFPAARIVGLDNSAAMLRAATQQGATGAELLCADACRMPLPDASVDLLFANLVLPWCDPLAGLREFARVLAPAGLLLASTTGPRTLEQIRLAWRRIDDAVHVHAGVDLQTVGDLLARCGLREPVLDVDCVTLRYSGTASLHAELRDVGAVNVAGGRRRSLTGRQRFRAYEDALRGLAGPGALSVSAEFVFLRAWGADPDPAAAGEPPSFMGIPLRHG